MSNQNTSATGGYLVPSQEPLNDDQLDDVLQKWLVGVSALDPTLVIPMWLPEPSEQPANETTWLAFGIKNRPRDWDSYKRHDPETDQASASDLVYYNEILEVQVVVYGPQSGAVCARVYANSRPSQNREQLYLSNLALIEVTAPRFVGEKVKEVWIRRQDFEVRLRHAVSLRYPVLDVAAAEISITTDGGSSVEFTVPDPEDAGFGTAGFGTNSFGE